MYIAQCEHTNSAQGQNQRRGIQSSPHRRDHLAPRAINSASRSSSSLSFKHNPPAIPSYPPVRQVACMQLVTPMTCSRSRTHVRSGRTAATLVCVRARSWVMLCRAQGAPLIFHSLTQLVNEKCDMLQYVRFMCPGTVQCTAVPR